MRQKIEMIGATTNDRRQKEQYGERRGWDTYNSDDYESTFGKIIPGELICESLTKMKEDGSFVMGVDIMGQGKPCIAVGCDSAIAVTLDSTQPEIDERLRSQLEQVSVNPIFGDAYSPQTSEKLVSAVDSAIQKNYKLGIVYFRPLGGLEPKNFKAFDVLYATLLKNYLYPLYDRLAPGGFIMVDITAFNTPGLKAAVENRVSRLDNAKLDFNGENYTTFCITKS